MKQLANCLSLVLWARRRALLAVRTSANTPTDGSAGGTGGTGGMSMLQSPAARRHRLRRHRRDPA